MKKATLHIIQGFLGAGKTTFSQKLAMEINAVHLNPDEWCVKLFSKQEYEQNWEKCFTQIREILWEKNKAYLLNGTDVIFDSGFRDKESRLYAQSIAIECGAEFKHYYIYVPDDIAKQRIAMRTGKIAENNLKNYNLIKKLFAEPDADEMAIVIHNY